MFKRFKSVAAGYMILFYGWQTIAEEGILWQDSLLYTTSLPLKYLIKEKKYTTISVM